MQGEVVTTNKLRLHLKETFRAFTDSGTINDLKNVMRGVSSYLFRAPERVTVSISCASGRSLGEAGLSGPNALNTARIMAIAAFTGLVAVVSKINSSSTSPELIAAGVVCTGLVLGAIHTVKSERHKQEQRS